MYSSSLQKACLNKFGYKNHLDYIHFDSEFHHQISLMHLGIIYLKRKEPQFYKIKKYRTAAWPIYKMWPTSFLILLVIIKCTDQINGLFDILDQTAPFVRLTAKDGLVASLTHNLCKNIQFSPVPTLIKRRNGDSNMSHNFLKWLGW